MSPLPTPRALTRFAIVATTALLVSGCAYDYMQTTDRVAYSAGDAVHANIERETTDPSSTNMNDLSALGSNGAVTPAAPPAGASTP